MQYLSLLLQVATLGLVAYLLIQFKALFREVRTPVVRQKGQLPADFRDRLRNVARPGAGAEAPKPSESRGPEGRGDRPENRDGRDRDRNRDGRDRDRNRDGRDRDRNRDGRDRNENRGDRPENRDGRDRDRNRDGRDRNENRGERPDRGPRPPRTEGAAESAPVAASDDSAPVASAPAPSFGGRRPLGPQASSEGSSSEGAPVDALAPSSLAQPVISDAPIRHGRRALPKAKPRFDDDDAAEA